MIAALFTPLVDERGQGLAEYALILGFIAVLCIAAVAYLGSSVLARYNSINSAYP